MQGKRRDRRGRKDRTPLGRKAAGQLARAIWFLREFHGGYSALRGIHVRCPIYPSDTFLDPLINDLEWRAVDAGEDAREIRGRIGAVPAPPTRTALTRYANRSHRAVSLPVLLWVTSALQSTIAGLPEDSRGTVLTALNGDLGEVKRLLDMMTGPLALS